MRKPDVRAMIATAAADIAPINHARDHAIQSALRAHLLLTKGQDAQAHIELAEAMKFALMAVRLEKDPDCRVSILPDDCGMADAAVLPLPAASVPNPIPDEYEMPGRPFE